LKIVGLTWASWIFIISSRQTFLSSVLALINFDYPCHSIDFILNFVGSEEI
jgi:hypothetical protein